MIEAAKKRDRGDRTEIQRAYYLKNRERILANEMARRKANPEKQALSNKQYRENNAEKISAYRSEYHTKNRDRSNKYWAARRSAKIKRTPSWFSEFDEFVMSEANNLVILRREATGIEWEVDHMIPLQAKIASGLHIGSNIQVIPMALNRSKRNKMIFTEPFEWMSR
jgi:hypothetical protein